MSPYLTFTSDIPIPPNSPPSDGYRVVAQVSAYCWGDDSDTDSSMLPATNLLSVAGLLPFHRQRHGILPGSGYGDAVSRLYVAA